MTFDLALRGASLADGRSGIDIAVKDGKIAEIGPQLGPAAQDARSGIIRSPVPITSDQ